MDFIRQGAYENYLNMPLHKAYKAVNYLDDKGISRMSEKPQAWKFERFIFDILPFANTVKVLVYPREICFAPLKNAQGPDSIETVQAALQHLDKITFEKITGHAAPPYPFELSQDFHYHTAELIHKWQGRLAPANNKYISL
jgi:UDP-N-acetylglucosamine/UDP-N-acetylgalactosamine diphosphorylase